jgi:Methyltransferase domain
MFSALSSPGHCPGRYACGVNEVPDPDLTSNVPGMGIFGWMTAKELLWLGDQAEKMDSIVEIGSLQGRSSYMLLSRCPGYVYCVDTWDEGRAYPAFLKNCGRFSNLISVQKTSLEAAELLSDFDMVFIDGSHEYEDVAADIAAWLPKTNKLICGHDYSNLVDYVDFPGVRKAVDEAFGKPPIRPPDTTIWAVELT